MGVASLASLHRCRRTIKMNAGLHDIRSLDGYAGGEQRLQGLVYGQQGMGCSANITPLTKRFEKNRQLTVSALKINYFSLKHCCPAVLSNAAGHQTSICYACLVVLRDSL